MLIVSSQAVVQSLSHSVVRLITRLQCGTGAKSVSFSSVKPLVRRFTKLHFRLSLMMFCSQVVRVTSNSGKWRKLLLV